MLYTTCDAWSQLRPRYGDRKTRHPGARERHSTLRQRLSDDKPLARSLTPTETSKTKRHASANHHQHRSSYSMNSAVSDFSRPRQEVKAEPLNEEHVVSQYKELSTIEAIRKSMKMTGRPNTAPPEHVPKWMMQLDINLDISSSDVIPAYDDNKNNEAERLSETFNERASFTFVESDSEDDIDELEYTEEMFKDCAQQHMSSKGNVTKQDLDKVDNVNLGSFVDKRKAEIRTRSQASRPKSNTFRIARGLSPTQSIKYGMETSSPRRYQGDKKVMSMQQGGIRSTPFQPKSKKFINQMITFNHMKHHDRKLKVAKPAVDTKMPSSFKYAIERKRIVEQRLTDSWLREIESVTPTKSVSSEHQQPHHSSSTPKQNKDRSKHR